MIWEATMKMAELLPLKVYPFTLRRMLNSISLLGVSFYFKKVKRCFPRLFYAKNDLALTNLEYRPTSNNDAYLKIKELILEFITSRFLFNYILNFLMPGCPFLLCCCYCCFESIPQLLGVWLVYFHRLKCVICCGF